MVVSRPIASPTPAQVVWHDIECGAYRADMPLWHELAGEFPGPILDVGAGTGRVTLELARAGRSLTALDHDPTLLDALAERARGLDVTRVAADARSFRLDRRDYALCLVPMQTIQLLGGSAQRVEFLRCARAHLRPGALLACAILGELEPFDCAAGDGGPAAERAQLDGLLYLSRATRVAETPNGVIIERDRRILSERDTDEQATEPAWERNVIELDRVDAKSLQHEGGQVGLQSRPSHEIEATAEHIGSSVVIFDV